MFLMYGLNVVELQSFWCMAKNQKW